MLVYVDHIYGPVVSKLAKHGWRVHRESGLEDSALERRFHRRISGLQMEKDFASMGDAMREFEEITRHDVISDEDQCGCPIHTFFCDEARIVVGGWECGKYMFHKWMPTPRQTIEALNTLVCMFEVE